MDPLHELRDLIAIAGNDNPVSREDHRRVYQFIKQKVLSPKSPFIKQVPSLQTVLYTIQNIFNPTFDSRRIPDLLDLLATVEFYRKRALDHANLATTWHNHYQEVDNTDCLPLDREVADFLQQLVSQAAAMRKIYIMLILNCCSLDLHLLWTATSKSVVDFLIRFNEYFPTLNETYPESPRLFWIDLSHEETAKLSNFGRQCRRFVRRSILSQSATDPSDTIEETQAGNAWPDFCSDQTLLERITYYTGYVMAASGRVQSMFPANHDA